MPENEDRPKRQAHVGLCAQTPSSAHLKACRDGEHSWRPRAELPTSLVPSSVGSFSSPSPKTHKQNPKLLWPECVTYGAISKSALRTKLVLYWHFPENEREETLGTQSQSKWLEPFVNFCQEEASVGELSLMMQGHSSKKTPLQKTAFLEGNLVICSQNLNNV